MACDRCGELERRLAAVERVAVESIDEMAGEGYTGWAAGARTRLDAALAGGSEAPAAPQDHDGHTVWLGPSKVVDRSDDGGPGAGGFEW